MNLIRAINRPSLKLKISALVLLLIFVSCWVLAYTVARRLEQDMTELLASQQFSQAAYMAEDIQLKLQSRVAALKNASAELTPEILSSTEQASQFLKEHKELSAMFTTGLALISSGGIGIADEPHFPAFGSVPYGDREYFKDAMVSGGTVFGKPRVGIMSQRPVVALAHPVRDAAGAIIAVLVGYVAVSDSSVFGLIERATFGKSGYVAICAPKYGVIVTSSNPMRVLDNMARPGVNSMVDKFVAGYEGSGVAVNSKGLATLTSAKQVPVAGWYVQIVLPTDEAFAPIVQMKRYAYGIAAILALLSTFVMWLIVRATLRPLGVATRSIYQMAKGRSSFHRLPVGGNDEVGKLLISFNLLVDQRQAAESALRQSNEVFQTILMSIRESILLFDAQKILLAINPVGAQRLGKKPEEMLGKSMMELIPQELAEERRAVLDEVLQTGEPVIHEDSRAGRIFSHACYPVLDKDGKVEAIVVVSSDITKQTQTQALLEAERRLAQSTLNSLNEHVCVVDASGIILMVNRAWQDFAKANRGNLVKLGVGSNYLAVCEAATDPDCEGAQGFADGLRAVLSGRQESFSMEYPCNSDAVQRFFSVKILRSPSVDGERAVIAHLDITERKRMEDQLRELATTDALTGLPNRRCFLAHVEEELHRVARKPETQAAVLMVDIDHFKQVNDTHGHATGDAALRLFAVTLEQVSRDIDMKGRLGGEEFALLLPGSDLVAAHTVAERLRTLVAETPLIQESYSIYLTVSIGISMLTAEDSSVDAVINRADQALYRAKKSGRNKVAS